MFTKDDLHYKETTPEQVGISHRALARALGLSQKRVAHLIRRGEWVHFEVKVPTSGDARRRGRYTIHVCLSGLDAHAFLLERRAGPSVLSAMHAVFKPTAQVVANSNQDRELVTLPDGSRIHNQALLYKQQVVECQARLELQAKVIARLTKERDEARLREVAGRLEEQLQEAKAQATKLQLEVDDLRRQLEHPELRAGSAKPAYLPGFKATGRYARIAWLSYQASSNLYYTKHQTREGHACSLLRELGLLDQNDRPTALGMRHSKLDGVVRVWEQGLGPLVRELAEERLAS